VQVLVGDERLEPGGEVVVLERADRHLQHRPVTVLEPAATFVPRGAQQRVALDR
jgi:hypothetical protein